MQVATRTIPLMVPYVPRGAVEAVSRVLESRWIGQGPLVNQFEGAFSAMLDRSCVAVGSCTDALHLAYLLAGIGPGDEVIAPVFTCTATNIPLLYCGATIRFCDVEPGGLNMDWRHAKSLITERTKAIVVVHYGGMPVSDELFRLGVPVIEDSAQAVGPRWCGQRGKFACFSFQAVKHITTGDGGMLALPGTLREEAVRRRWFGIDRVAKLKGIWENDITEVGYKYQMTDIAAAMGLDGLRHLDDQIDHRRAMRARYMELLRLVGGIRIIDQHPESACWLCTVTVERRADFRRKLAEAGIETDQTHYRNDRYSIFRQFCGEFPHMDRIDPDYLVLPMHMGMDVEDVEYICQVIRSGW